MDCLLLLLSYPTLLGLFIIIQRYLLFTRNRKPRTRFYRGCLNNLVSNGDLEVVLERRGKIKYKKTLSATHLTCPGSHHHHFLSPLALVLDATVDTTDSLVVA